MTAFGELWRRHEELTRSYAKLLHDDAGQVLTAIALRLSSLELSGEAKAEAEELQGILDDLLERFRRAQASLGAAAVAKRGLAAGLSQLARFDGNLRLQGETYPAWTGERALAAFRIVEALGAQRVTASAEKLVVSGREAVGAYHEEMARAGGLRLQRGSEGITISIQHGD